MQENLEKMIEDYENEASSCDESTTSRIVVIRPSDLKNRKKKRKLQHESRK